MLGQNYAEPIITDLGGGWWQWQGEETYMPALPGTGEDFSWSEILANFGFYSPALGAIAAAIANPSYRNVLAVDSAYRRGGYEPPSALMNWLWKRYYEDLPYGIPGQVAQGVGEYWPLILVAVAVFAFSRK